MPFQIQQMILNAVAKHETRSSSYKDKNAVIKVQNDTEGSKSYGAFGINDKKGSLKEWLNYEGNAKKFGLDNMDIFSPAFKVKYIQVANARPDEIAESQARYVENVGQPSYAIKSMMDPKQVNPALRNSKGILSAIFDAYDQEGHNGKTGQLLQSGKFKDITNYQEFLNLGYALSDKTKR